MQHQGKFIVLSILALALGLAIFNIVYQNRQSRRSLDYWGTDAGQLISTAPRAELRRLTPRGDGDDLADKAAVTLRGQRYDASPAIDIGHARGFTHVRRALLIDRTFTWNDPRSTSAPRWRYALKFSDGPNNCVLLLDEPCLHVALAESEAMLAVRPSDGASPLAPFFAEQYVNE